MESVDGSDVNSDDEIFEKLSIDEEDDNTDIVDEDKKRKSKTKTKKKKGRNVYTPPHVRRIRSAQDRINELSYVKLDKMWNTKVVYGSKGESIQSVETVIRPDQPDRGDIMLLFKMECLNDSDKLNKDIDVVILYGGALLVSVHFPQSYTNFIQGEADDGSMIWLADISTHHIYARVTLIKNDPWSSISTIVFRTNMEDLVSICMMLGTTRNTINAIS